MNCIACDTLERFRQSLSVLYEEDDVDRSMRRLELLLSRQTGQDTLPRTPLRLWNQEDVVLISYGDMIQTSHEPPLQSLHQFCRTELKDSLNTVHILPFFPYSSDDGFSVIDYRRVAPELGTWENIAPFADDFFLGFDLVLNHVSRDSAWFRDYVAGIMPARGYFIEMNPSADLSEVVRPRSLPLLTATPTRDGVRHLWTTFSEDQIDLDFRNPDVLFEFLDIMLLFVENGARILRLDAIAYLWKQLGTSCIHRPQTHEIVKLMRGILGVVAPHVLLLTETNVPHEENVSYFGEQDEAHVVYQFTLPPLLLHVLLNGDSRKLSAWAAGVSEAPEGCTYLNFTASHDGVGVRPLEGLLTTKQIDALCKQVKARGGHVSTKRNADGSDSPYEMNITYFDALSDDPETVTPQHIDRFLCSQVIAMALKGIPAIYFNSLIGARNNRDGVAETGAPRTINREKWNLDVLRDRLSDPASASRQVFDRYRNALRVRRSQSAFDPDAAQQVLALGRKLFGVRRSLPETGSTIVAVSNVTATPAHIALAAAIPELEGAASIMDLLSGESRKVVKGQLGLAPYESLWIAPPVATDAGDPSSTT